MSTDDGPRITVSQAVLKLELDNLALRLTNDLASKDSVEKIRERVERLEREKADRAAVLAASASTFSRREKVLGLVAAFAVVAIQLVFHYGGHL